jgi:DnaK suppressor protein
LRLIEAALARIAAGDYGICLRCEEDINPRRLALDPTLPLCITCASAREKS